MFFLDFEVAKLRKNNKYLLIFYIIFVSVIFHVLTYLKKYEESLLVTITYFLFRCTLWSPLSYSVTVVLLTLFSTMTLKFNEG